MEGEEEDIRAITAPVRPAWFLGRNGQDCVSLAVNYWQEPMENCCGDGVMCSTCITCMYDCLGHPAVISQFCSSNSEAPVILHHLFCPALQKNSRSSSSSSGSSSSSSSSLKKSKEVLQAYQVRCHFIFVRSSLCGRQPL